MGSSHDHYLLYFCHLGFSLYLSKLVLWASFPTIPNDTDDNKCCSCIQVPLICNPVSITRSLYSLCF